MSRPKCTNCRLKLRLEKWDYSKRGVPKQEQEGYVCLAFANEGLAAQLVGIDPEDGGCEVFVSKGITKTAGETYTASEE